MMQALADDADLEHLMVDGSIVQINQHGATKNSRGHLSHGQVPEGD